MTNSRASSIHDNRYRAIIDILVHLRRECNISQAVLAERVGLTQPDVSKIERCERRIDILEFVDFLHAITNSDRALIDAAWKRINECDD